MSNGIEVEVFPVAADRWIAAIMNPAGAFSTEATSAEGVAEEVASAVRDVLGQHAPRYRLVDEMGAPWTLEVAARQSVELRDQPPEPLSEQQPTAGHADPTHQRSDVSARSQRALRIGLAFTVFAVVASAASSDAPVRQGLATLVACAIGVGLVVLVARRLEGRVDRR